MNYFIIKNSNIENMLQSIKSSNNIQRIKYKISVLNNIVQNVIMLQKTINSNTLIDDIM